MVVGGQGENLSTEQLEVLVGGWARNAAYASKLRDVELLGDIGRVMLEEENRDIIPGHLWASNMLALGFRILQTTPDSRSDHLKLQLREDTSHLEECRGHRIDLTAPAVDGDATDDLEAQMFLLDDVYNFAQLLRAAAQTADFQRDQGIALLHAGKKEAEVLFDGGISVLIFKNNLIRTCGFQLPDLAIDVLFVFAGGTARITEVLHIISSL